MNRKFYPAVAGAVVALVVVLAVGVAAAASSPSVTVQVKSLTKTLLRPTSVHGEKGWITKGGTPRGKCSGNSAAGALSAATHGKWTGKYYSGIGIFVTSILGAKPKRSDFWEVLVNNKVAGHGICETKLHAGERLLFKITK